MILHSLYAYSQRKASDPGSNFAPRGFIEKRIDFFIIIKDDGSYVDVESQQEIVKKGKSKKLVGKPLFVPAIDKQAVKHTMAGNDANLLWDNAGFVLGLGKNGNKKRTTFVNTILQYYEVFPSDVAAIVKFYEKELLFEQPFFKIINHPEYGDVIRSGNVNITFKIDGELFPVINSEHVQTVILEYRSVENIIGNCLITGDCNCIIEPTHWAIHGIVGAQTSGANLVSFNSDAYCSYGKEQSNNAPVSKLAAMEYTKALQYLINSEKNRVRLVDTTVVFWSQKNSLFEEVFPAFFRLPTKDDPDSDVKAVKALYEGVWTGQFNNDSETRFYVLGLTPNVARISVRFWHVATIKEFAQNICQHYKDIDIQRSLKDTRRYAIFWLLSALALQNDVDNVSPILSGQIVQSILTGSQYPATMLHQTIRRIRATQNVSRIQAGILKAYLNRHSRIYSTKEEEITVALDPINKNPGYLLGRLFAVLEKIQEEASPGINTTIRDRFYGAASSTPITVFPQLLKLKNHHLSKLINRGRKVNFEKMLAGIIDGLDPCMPSHLAMADQARFAVGYYHQRQSFF